MFHLIVERLDSEYIQQQQDLNFIFQGVDHKMGYSIIAYLVLVVVICF